ncbi:MAG: exonuclease SbcCD subunit D [Clostridia bacterium]|nr:exonuclease SbcCD subunit D [Clostridia bacterium]
MRFFHLSDLHIGKRLGGYSLLEDQQYILNEILSIARQQTPDAFLLAGDIYDKAVPSAEAVQLFDLFLTQLAELGKPIFIISGNHDSAERIAFGADILRQSQVYFSPLFKGKIEPITLQDEYGELDIYLLPFIKPSTVRPFFPDTQIESYQDAVAAVVSSLCLDPSRRNLLVAHQFVAGARPADSEELSVGGTEQVGAALFAGFDYVALGHIHRPQQVTRPTVRYCGTPLAYSFSECEQEKSITVVTIKEKGEVSLSFLPLVPLRRLREIRGSYMEIADRRNYAGTNLEDYVHIILTDEEEIPDAVAKLRSIYPHIMQLTYDNRRTQATPEMQQRETHAKSSPLDLFNELYTLQNNAPLNDAQTRYLQTLIETIWEGAEQ